MSSAIKYIIFGSVLSLALSHTPQKVRVDTGKVKPDTLKQAEPDNTKVRVDTMAEDIDEIRYGRFAIPTDQNEFPSIHPFIVYFAISLILFAAFLQLMNLFFFKKDIAWIVFLLIIAGFAATLLSSRTFQLQATGFSDDALGFIQFHDVWAQWTLRTAFTALILQIIHLGMTRFDMYARVTTNTSNVSYRKNRFIMLIIAAVMLFSAYSILRAGHLGSQIVNILHQNTPAFMNM